jgi:hypothetical protein
MNDSEKRHEIEELSKRMKKLEDLLSTAAYCDLFKLQYEELPRFDKEFEQGCIDCEFISCCCYENKKIHYISCNCKSCKDQKKLTEKELVSKFESFVEELKQNIDRITYR